MTAARGRGGMIAAALVAAAYFAATRSGTFAPPEPATSASPSSSSNVALGQSMAAADGWTGGQFTCLNELWTRESGWRTEVWNTAGSGAYGIPQALPASKMAAAGADYMTSPATQIRWGLGYIAARYGTPCGAWSHETSAGWY